MDDIQLRSVEGLHANSSMGGGAFLIQFSRQTRGGLHLRPIGEFLKRMVHQFSAAAKERETYYLDELLSIRRESGDTIQ